MRFLFWNANRAGALPSIGRLVEAQSVDTLILAECPVEEAAMLEHLNGLPSQASGLAFWSSSPIVKTSLKIYTRAPKDRFGMIDGVPDTSHFLLRQITADDGNKYVLAAVHLISPMWASAETQRQGTADAAKEVRRAESIIEKDVRRSIVVGDFNLDPFDPGVANANRFHGVMSREEASQERRLVLGKPYEFYYNPMWGLLGDREGRPPGTYYYLDGIDCLFWHMFDQVLVRPSLISAFKEKTLAVLDHDGRASLLTSRGRPNPDVCDHLPLVFSMDL